MNKKLPIYIGIALAIFTAFVLVLAYKKDKAQLTAENPAFSKYISAYTSGIISKGSSIKVRLLSSIVDKIDTSQSLPDDLFETDPAIEGSVSWVNNTTLEFTPNEKLKSNTTYFTNFKLDKLFDVAEDLEDFNFEFHTIKQSMAVRYDGLITTDKKTLKWQKITGRVLTADNEVTENIADIINASIDGNSVTIKWLSTDGKEHLFEIDSVPRKNKAYAISLTWNGDKIGSKDKDELSIEIPALGDFKLLSARVIHGPEQYLSLQFSDPLDPLQDLSGLIEICKIRDLQFIIEENSIRVYPPARLNEKCKVNISSGIKNILGYKYNSSEELDIAFEEMKPAVRLISKGVILPESDQGLVIPFEAVNLNAVDVQIIRVFESNVLQFLQVNNLDGSYQLRRVGTPVVQKTIRLDNSDVVDFGQWNRFSLDLNELIKAEPGAIYRVSLGFRQQFSMYGCPGTEKNTVDNLQDIDQSWSVETESSYWDAYGEGYYNDYYYDGDYWNNRDNPCHRAYYGRRHMVSQNIFASNIGLIAKKGADGVTHVFVTDLRTTKPLSNVRVGLYSYQNQLIEMKTSDVEGRAVFTDKEKSFFIIADNNGEKGYLKIDDGNSLSLSRFDVSGNVINKGLKGYIYGERGVWRPGDSVFVSFALHEEAKPLPLGHPIIFEMKNPNGQLVNRIVQQKNKQGFYTFRTTTAKDAPTGNWSSVVKIGGVSFQKTLKIETVKPNRLKITYDHDDKYISSDKAFSTKLNAKWLHGAIAGSLKAKVDVILRKSKTTFSKFATYTFDDPTRDFSSESQTIFDGMLDNQGETTITPDISIETAAGGMLQATFVTKVFEKGGDFSIDKFTIPYYPYASYVGVNLPKGDKARGMLLTDKDHDVKIVTLDAQGNKINAPHTVEVEFYKLSWKWWWDNSGDNTANYTNRSYIQPISKEKITTKNGEGKSTIRVNYPDWGRYLVRVNDLTSGHSSAKIVYIDWPGWAGRAQTAESGGASMLLFSSDKNEYSVGEKITLTIPTPKQGRALVSLENGTQIIESHWVEPTGNETKFTFTATKEMSPNIFAHVTLLQPHAQTKNNLPIRMYGVIPISVENPETHITPKIVMSDELESEKTFTIKVSEKDNKPMTYTLAVVDEGLLDLTRYKTPDAWNVFYAREALGVKTWDAYDWIIGAYGGKLERLLSVGGDDEGKKAVAKKANRFEPVVMFLGPFHLESGQKTHTLKMPRYIGSVRTMVVAGYNGAYGSAEKAVPVKKPLMVLGTLPRVLSPDEKVKMPVSVFAMKDNMKNVKVEIKTNGLLKQIGGASKSVSFAKPGEKTISFDLVSLNKSGIAKVEIIATSGNIKSTYEIELDIRIPNPSVTDVVGSVIESGKNWKTNIKPFGIGGTNRGIIEVSAIPPLSLEKRMQYLITYPHGCIEQTTSGAFPQLFLSDLTDISAARKDRIDGNIKAAISRIRSFQIYNGSLSYWPNGSDTDEWGTCYAGHFMFEASKKGFVVPNDFTAKWKQYQKKKARKWTDDGRRSQLIQAYRLYTLALSGSPEKGSMNRLRENKKLSVEAKWRLAAAYYLTGKERVAKKMVEGLKTEPKDYSLPGATYGSTMRDKAMILETLNMLKINKEAFNILREISTELSANKWLSTQTTAYALIAISKYVKENVTSNKVKFSYQIAGGKSVSKTGNKAVIQVDVPINNTKEFALSINNQSSGILYARIITEGVPKSGTETNASNGIKLDVRYLSADGKKITPNKITQGNDFVAEVSIKNMTAQNLQQIALTQMFPSGWEIINTRLLGLENISEGDKPQYQDIRDDRVYSYFDLKAGQTKKFRIMLTASYTGEYYLPAVYCEAMYDATINARRKGLKTKVVTAGW